MKILDFLCSTSIHFNLAARAYARPESMPNA